MNYDLQDPNLDFEGNAAAILRALRQSQIDKSAAFPEAKVHGRVFLSSGGGGIASAAMDRATGALNERQAMADQQSLNGEQSRRADDWIQSMPSETGPEGDAPRAAHMVEGMKIPMLRKALESQVGQEFDRPYQRESALARTTAAIELKKQADADKAESARLQREFQAGQNELYRRTAADQNSLLTRALAAREAKSAKGPATGGAVEGDWSGIATKAGETPEGAPIMRHKATGKMFVIGADGMPTAYVPGQTPAIGQKAILPDAAAKKAIHEAGVGIDNIDDALAALKEHPKAFGMVNAIPGADTFRQYTDPDGVAARGKVSNIGSMKLHDRTGAAVTASEFPRLRPFIPSMHDTPAKIEQNLKDMKREYKLMQEEWGTGIGPGAVSTPAAAPAKRRVFNPSTGVLE